MASIKYGLQFSSEPGQLISSISYFPKNSKGMQLDNRQSFDSFELDLNHCLWDHDLMFPFFVYIYHFLT